MAQIGIQYDHNEVQIALSRAHSVARKIATAHGKAQPALPTTAAGRDFTSTATRLQAAFDRVHAAGQRRIDAVAESLSSGLVQADHFTRTDKESAAGFRGDLP